MAQKLCSPIFTLSIVQEDTYQSVYRGGNILWSYNITAFITM